LSPLHPGCDLLGAPGFAERGRNTVCKLKYQSSFDKWLVSGLLGNKGSLLENVDITFVLFGG
jgi:hypothetical protein